MYAQTMIANLCEGRDSLTELHNDLQSGIIALCDIGKRSIEGHLKIFPHASVLCNF